MKLNPLVRPYIDCTYEERKSLLPVVDLLVQTAAVARREGLLALEEMGKCYSRYPLYQIGIELIVDGTHPEIYEEILHNHIILSQAHNTALLESYLILCGLMAVQEGRNPRLIFLELCLMLGMDVYLDHKREVVIL